MANQQCRACFRNQNELINLFTKIRVDGIETDYATMMMVSSGIVISLDDGYSKGICAECLKNLVQAFSFKKMCENSQNAFDNKYTSTTARMIKSEHKSTFSIINPHDSGNLVIQDNDLHVFQNGPKITKETDQSCNNNIARQETINYEENVSDNGDNLNYVSKSNRNRQSRIQCEQCKKTFKNSDLYTVHLANHGLVENRSLKQFHCQECDKTYKTLSGMKYHISSHIGIKKHKCTYENCEWSFISKQALQRHMMKHLDIKTFLCNICGKRYSTKDSLDHHIKTHMVTRPYKCDHCDKSFIQSCHLKAHEVGHEGTKPYICEVCGRLYSRKAPLKVHFEKFCGRGVQPVFKYRNNEKCYTTTNNNIDDNDCDSTH